MDYTELANRFLSSFYGFRKIGQQKKFDESMRGEGFVLLYISKQGGSVLPGDISGTMHISSARIAAALNSLENKELVTRRIDRNDRRRILVDLTPEGEKLVEGRSRMVIDRTRQMLEALGERDAEEFVRILEKISKLAPQFDMTEEE